MLKTLSEIQNSLQAAILTESPSSEILNELQTQTSWSVEQRYKTYERGIWQRWMDSLLEDFGRIREIYELHGLGSNTFKKVLKLYLQAYVPTEFTLKRLGKNLEGYLRGQPHFPDWLADAVAFEWARYMLGETQVCEAFETEKLSLLEMFAPNQIKLHLNGDLKEGFVWVSSRYDIPKVLTGSELERGDLKFWILYKENNDVMYEASSEVEITALQKMKDSHLQDVLEHLSQSGVSTEQIQNLFSSWMSKKLIADITVSE